jgi:type I restriction-modification system DNA methylase subunit
VPCSTRRPCRRPTRRRLGVDAVDPHDTKPSLEGVLQHIDFNRRVGNTTVPDKKWRDLIDHFSKYRLRNEDFEFPDLLGAAYEYLIRDFADSAGKKGGDFYTPRPVVQLMVRLLDPAKNRSFGLPPERRVGDHPVEPATPSIWAATIV